MFSLKNVVWWVVKLQVYISLIFTRSLGFHDPIWPAYFSDGVEKKKHQPDYIYCTYIFHRNQPNVGK